MMIDGAQISMDFSSGYSVGEPKRVMFSRKSDEWPTPQETFDELNAEFHFDLDPCATDENHKCENYFTAEQDGLSKNWGGVQSVLQSPIQ